MIRTSTDSRRGQSWTATMDGVLSTPAEEVIAARSRAPKVRALITEMNARAGNLLKSPTWSVKADGFDVRSALQRFILGNPNVTNEMLFELSQITVEDLRAPDWVRARVAERAPDAPTDVARRLTVALMAAVSPHIDPEVLSREAPDLGLRGSARVKLFPWSLLSPDEWVPLPTVLHDFTDFARVRAPGINQALWGREGSIRSAIASLMVAAEWRSSPPALPIVPADLWK